MSSAWNTACPEQIRRFGEKGLSLETRLEGRGLDKRRNQKTLRAATRSDLTVWLKGAGRGVLPEETLRRGLQGPGLQMRGDGNRNKKCACAGVGRMKITGFRNYMGRTLGLRWFYIHTHTHTHTHTNTKKSLR